MNVPAGLPRPRPARPSASQGPVSPAQHERIIVYTSVPLRPASTCAAGRPDDSVLYFKGNDS
ncbi:hypothetical protein E2C01_025782 [Portunus trituberculatus]|uniref:Uncharacterized protein n=1 Tax=Portunus trituberculatus TaxID=210409 RepID=A0A5B7EE99_PORTR|nr:hypothetical protein [Portunus trituberculatus]